MRRVPLVLLVSVLVSLSGPAPAAGAADCLRPPVDAPVVDPFREPACQWCPGNRGLEYAVAPGIPVSAAAAGTVSFAGSVAGVRYVVVDHGDGLRTTYGRLGEIAVGPGDVITVSAVVGRAGDGLYFGLREGERYLDPAPRLARRVRRPRLVPLDGTPPRPAPAATWTCPGG